MSEFSFKDDRIGPGTPEARAELERRKLTLEEVQQRLRDEITKPFREEISRLRAELAQRPKPIEDCEDLTPEELKWYNELRSRGHLALGAEINELKAKLAAEKKADEEIQEILAARDQEIAELKLLNSRALAMLKRITLWINYKPATPTEMWQQWYVGEVGFHRTGIANLIKKMESIHGI
jgi:hypothetical protein